MAKSLYKYSEVVAQTAKPLAVNQMIKDVLKANDDACYCEMEPFLIPPGLSGSRQFDQAYAVDILMQHDAKNGGQLATVMENSTLSRRLLWDRLQSVLRQGGFKIQHGRIVGLIERSTNGKQIEKDDSETDGQPDID